MNIFVEFFGQQIYRGGINLTEAKLKVVKDWDTPKYIKDVKSFLGFTNYYRLFVKDFPTIMDPLTALTKKNEEQ